MLMRIPLIALYLLFIHTLVRAQSFEGVLQIDYRTLSGSRNASDVYVKGSKFFIKRVFGGCDRYDGYILDTGTHILTCLSPQNPKTALSLDADKVLDIYETKHIKPGFKKHLSFAY